MTAASLSLMSQSPIFIYTERLTVYFIAIGWKFLENTHSIQNIGHLHPNVHLSPNAHENKNQPNFLKSKGYRPRPWVILLPRSFDKLDMTWGRGR